MGSNVFVRGRTCSVAWARSSVLGPPAVSDGPRRPHVPRRPSTGRRSDDGIHPQGISTDGALAAGAGLAAFGAPAAGYVPSAAEVPPGDRPPPDRAVEVLNPRGRVPLSFIIDDSTCLVNMGRFCIPQFRAAWPQNPAYWKPWKEWPAEIPDAFLREFGEFCAEQGVRGKFSLVPYPACVGWLDRELPGWTRKELRDSLQLVRDLMVPRWDITPEMLTHTHVIDLKTGRPLDPPGPATMENSYPPQKKSADELAAYIAYALQVLKNADIPCAGVTTPGGFGNACKSELSLAMGQALTDVFATEIPFYFKYIADGAEYAGPHVEHAEGPGAGRPVTRPATGPATAPANSPRLVVDVPAGTGDWFGNWDGDQVPTGDKYINEDGTAGRMVELIERGEPAVMFGHWAGFYSNGSRRGFEACKRVVTTLNRKFRDRTVWMKTSEMARYLGRPRAHPDRPRPRRDHPHRAVRLPRLHPPRRQPRRRCAAGEPRGRAGRAERSGEPARPGGGDVVPAKGGRSRLLRPGERPDRAARLGPWGKISFSPCRPRLKWPGPAAPPPKSLALRGRARRLKIPGPGRKRREGQATA